jgi:hypothetical protein
LVLLAPLLSVIAGCASYQTAPATHHPLQSSSAENAIIRLDDGYVLSNNIWNKGAASGPYTEDIFRDVLNGAPVFGWEWQWPSSSNVVSYPEVIYGDKPWGPDLKLVPAFPFLVGSRNITARFDITLEAKGFYNMAFSLWIVSSLPATREKITHEIMIWNFNHFGEPAGIRRGTVEVGGVTYDLYVRESHGDASGQNANTWTYVAFAARTPVLKGPLQISLFVDYLLAKGILARDEYLTSVELGNEIMEGTGKVLIQGYSIVVE